MPNPTRAALAYLLLTGVVVGVWAAVLPSEFYAAFPGFGRVWVAVDGPYNEHLIRDTGAAYLMIGVVAGLTLFRPGLIAPFAAGAATLAFNLPHAAYHFTHLHIYGPLDRVLNVIVLTSAGMCSAWLMTPMARIRTAIG